MNKQTNSLLSQLRVHLEAKAKSMKCEECGASIASEAVKQGDGKMLCEKCAGMGESYGYDYDAGLDEEKGPVVAKVPSESNPEKEYEIRLGKDGNFYCSCPAWKNMKKPVKDRICKHIKTWAKAHDMKLPEGAVIMLDNGEVMVLEMATEDVAKLIAESRR